MSIFPTEPRRQSHLPGTCIILVLNLLSFTKYSFCTEPRRHDRDIATSNRAIFTSPTATRTLASTHSSFGSVTSSQSSGHNISITHDRRDEQEEEQDIDQNFFRENDEQEDNTYHASSSSKRHQRPNPPPVITKKYRATDAEKLTAAWNHSKGLAQAQQHLPASRLGSKHS